MSCLLKDHDKDICKLLYKFSSAVRSIDNILRFAYASKPANSTKQEPYKNMDIVFILLYMYL